MGGFDYRPYGDLVINRFCFHQPDPPETWDGRWCDHSVGRFPWAGESQIPESLLADGVVTRESLAFLLEHTDKNPDKPWLLCAGYGRPHFPLTAPGRYVRRAIADGPVMPPKPPGYPDSLHPHDRFMVDDFRLTHFSEEEHRHALASYYACVDYLDDCIGELLDGLKNAGLLENTYIIYTTDHGDMTGEHGLWCKRTYYDASAGVPLLIAGPGIPRGKSVACPVELLDLFPTFCDLAGVPIPDGLDGESLAPVLRAKRDRREKRFAVSALLAEPRPVQFRMARDERWKYVEFPEAPPVLFDLATDPGENVNLLVSGANVSAAPLDDLRAAASDGLSWAEIDALRAEETAHRPKYDKPSQIGPVQYQLWDGRVVDADVFLYPGIEENR
jgi:choline-sulfatase